MLNSDYSAIVSATTLAGSSSWAKGFGSTGSELGRAVGVDSNNNILIAISFQGTVDFGGQSLTSFGSLDIALAKYSPNGNLIWVRQAGGVGEDTPLALAIDSFDNICLTGQFNNTATFDTTMLASAGESDVFLAKYDSNGNSLWAKRFGGSMTDKGITIACNSSGDIFLGGWFKGTINFGGPNLVSPFSGIDSFIAKFDSNGNHIWSKNFTSNSDDQCVGIALDSNSNLYVVGQYLGAIDCGGGNMTSLGAHDIYLAKLDTNGNHIWSKRLGKNNSEIPNGIAIDSLNNIYITGYFYFSTDLGGGTINASADYSAFVAKYDSNGNFLWANHSTGFGSQFSNSVAINPTNNNVLIVGYFQYRTNFGGGEFFIPGGSNGFIATYSSGGGYLSSEQIGNTSNTSWDAVKSIIVGSDGKIIIAGYFQESITLGGQILNSAGGYDAFLYKF